MWHRLIGNKEKKISTSIAVTAFNTSLICAFIDQRWHRKLLFIDEYMTIIVQIDSLQSLFHWLYLSLSTTKRQKLIKRLRQVVYRTVEKVELRDSSKAEQFVGTYLLLKHSMINNYRNANDKHELWCIVDSKSAFFVARSSSTLSLSLRCRINIFLCIIISIYLMWKW